MQVLPTDYGGQAELIPLQVYVKDHLPKTEVFSLLYAFSHTKIVCQQPVSYPSACAMSVLRVRTSSSASCR